MFKKVHLNLKTRVGPIPILYNCESWPLEASESPKQRRFNDVALVLKGYGKVSQMSFGPFVENSM